MKAASKNALVAVIVGSPGDLGHAKKATEVLEDLEIPYELRVLSAHRTLDQTIRFVKQAEARGIRLLIAGAGMANHLAGVCAASCLLPVIGVPLGAAPLGGLDSLLSTVQMPTGVPVATVAVNGMANAAYLAARILAINDARLRERLCNVQRRMRDEYAAAAQIRRTAAVDSERWAANCERWQGISFTCDSPCRACSAPRPAS